MKHREYIEVIARGLVRDGTRVLVCRNLKTGYCFLPGGHVEFGESAATALRREFEEESGERVTVGACCLVSEVAFDDGRSPHHEMNLLFHVKLERDNSEITSREPKIGFEWIEVQALGRSDFRPRSTLRWLEKRAAGRGAEPRLEWDSDIDCG